MIEQLDLSNALTMVVTGVPHFPSYQQMDEVWKKLWNQHSARYYTGQDPALTYTEYAGLYAEFSKAMSVGFGSFEKWGKNFQLKVKIFSGADEERIIKDSVLYIEKHIRFKEQVLVSHGGRENDFPFISRRIISHRVALPNCLVVGNKAPWELNLLDTQEIWKFSAPVYRVSIEALAMTMGITIPHFDRTETDIRSSYHENPDSPVIKEFTAN